VRIVVMFIIIAVALMIISPATPTGVSRFRETQITHFSYGNYPGTAEVWRTRVWLLNKLQAVGTGAMACVYVDLHTDIRECNGTYIFPRGRIQVAGEIITRASFQLTIIGGTGVYSSAGGTAIFSGLPNPALITLFIKT